GGQRPTGGGSGRRRLGGCRRRSRRCRRRAGGARPGALPRCGGRGGGDLDRGRGGGVAVGGQRGLVAIAGQGDGRERDEGEHERRGQAGERTPLTARERGERRPHGGKCSTGSTAADVRRRPAAPQPRMMSVEVWLAVPR